MQHINFLSHLRDIFIQIPVLQGFQSIFLFWTVWLHSWKRIFRFRPGDNPAPTEQINLTWCCISHPHLQHACESRKMQTFASTNWILQHYRNKRICSFKKWTVSHTLVFISAIYRRINPKDPSLWYKGIIQKTFKGHKVLAPSKGMPNVGLYKASLMLWNPARRTEIQQLQFYHHYIPMHRQSALSNGCLSTSC